MVNGSERLDRMKALGQAANSEIPAAPGDVSARNEWGKGFHSTWRHHARPALQALLLAALLLIVFWPGPAWGLPVDGGPLFELHCAGCHPRGGNIIRRGRTLRLADLQRQGIVGPEAVARIAAAGIGRMDGYGAVLGEGGPELLGSWVWEQALADWPRGVVPPLVEAADSARAKG
jgi:cytochrome c6